MQYKQRYPVGYKYKSALPSYRTKTCPRCKKQFLGRGDPPIYCSSKCQRQARNDRRRKKPGPPNICQTCRRRIADQQRVSRQFCSNACRQRAYRQRHAEA